ncbi:MAG: extracellular solute-binding protein, partial [Salana multivorans]|nr:extracellular solute-binding protein [Salana multivorans]
YEESLALFKEKYPNVTVQTSWQAFPDYWTARNTEAAGSALPDVLQFDSSYLREYANANRLLDLSEYVDSGAIDLSGFDESLVAAGNLNDVQVGIPTSTNTLGMFVNPTVIEQTGVEFPADGYTWADLNEFIEKTHAAGVKNADGYDLYGSGDYTGTFWFFLQWLIQNGTDPFSDDGQLNFTQDDVKDWFALTADVRQQEAQFPVARGVALSPLGGFTMNEVSSEMSWSNFMAGYTADSGTDSIELHPIPSGPDGTANFFRPSMLLSAGANTKNPEAAAALINFLLTDPEVGTIFGTSKGVPADVDQRAAVQAEDGSVDAKVLAYEEYVATTTTSTAPIPVKGFGTIEEKWRQLSEEIQYGNLTVDQFVTEWWAEAEMAIL